MIDHPDLDEFETVPQPSMTITISHADPRALNRALLAAFDAVANVGGVELQVMAEPEPEPFSRADRISARIVGAAVVLSVAASAAAFTALIIHWAWGLL
jgi:hypothetical protein